MHTCSVAIVNWNSASWLENCIKSLFDAATDAEIIVVDNASNDSSLKPVLRFRNKVHVIQNSVNRGLAAALNQAFRATSGRYVLVLNPDVRVTPGAVKILQEFLYTHPRAGAVGGHLDGQYLPRRFPTSASLIGENLGLSRLLAAMPAPEGERIAIAVDQPAAAALMVRREAYDEIGGFDEQFYPAWYEDVDFCRRLKTAGWEVYFAPAARFHHKGGYSADVLGTDNFAHAYYSNQMRYTRKHLGLVATATVRASIAAGMIGRILARPRKARAYASVLWKVLKG